MLVYKHTSKTSNKSYIGYTKYTMESRFSVHVGSAENNSTNHFHRAIRKYGVNDFVSIIIEDNISEELVAEREIYWIDYYDTFKTGYNMTLGGEGRLGVTLSDETKSKISNALNIICENGKTIAENSAVLRVETIKNNGGFSEIAEKSSNTQKKNGKSKGKNNPMHDSREIMIFDKLGDLVIKTSYYDLTRTKVIKDFPSRAFDNIRKTRKRFYNKFPPRDEKRIKFIGWHFCYSDEMWCNI